jgi:hypothetical protein
MLICGLFKDSLNCTDYVALNDRMMVNNELERCGKK